MDISNTKKGFALFTEQLNILLDNHAVTNKNEDFFVQIAKAKHYNRWFTETFVRLRLKSILNFLLSPDFENVYNKWAAFKGNSVKKIGIFSEEHIPLEEFPLLLAILVSGNAFQYKTHDKSDKVLVGVFNLLGNCVPDFKERIEFSDMSLKNAESLIWTQQEDKNTQQLKYLTKRLSLLDTRYQSVAILKGDEDSEELSLIGNDIFNFFGQGSGNVRKVYIPQGFDIRKLYKAIESWYSIMDSSPYANNYQYHQSVYLMNRIDHLDNGFLLVKEDTSFRAPTGVLFYEFYSDYKKQLSLLENSDQCSNIYLSLPSGTKHKAFGDSANQILLPPEKLTDLIK